jgi:Bcr/CflA subfamily drug resistance transporter
VLSEAAYTPSLPDIANSLHVDDKAVEHTITIYLFAFALGTLFWGKLSDKYGRKPFILIGFAIYILGSIGCYLSSSIELLLISRFIQAFGGSVGSVIGQAICRDAFHGPDISKIFATIGIAIAVLPAISPTIGGILAENYGWPAVFLFLIVAGSIVWTSALFTLPETHYKEHRRHVALRHLAIRMLTDRTLIGYGLLIAACNGIRTSYLAEGPFYFIKILGLSPSTYGASFIGAASAAIVGNLISRKLIKHYHVHQIIRYGILAAVTIASIFAVIIVSTYMSSTLATTQSKHILAGVSLACIILLLGSLPLIFTNVLAIALENYKDVTGTASSLFGFFYYIMISVFNLGMGFLHNATILPIPIYFLFIALFMLVVSRVTMRDSLK